MGVCADRSPVLGFGGVVGSVMEPKILGEHERAAGCGGRGDCHPCATGSRAVDVRHEQRLSVTAGNSRPDREGMVARSSVSSGNLAASSSSPQEAGRPASTPVHRSKLCAVAGWTNRVSPLENDARVPQPLRVVFRLAPCPADVLLGANDKPHVAEFCRLQCACPRRPSCSPRNLLAKRAMRNFPA